MTNILISWLRAEDLVNDAVSIEERFSNGYLIGKLLNKYGMQKDFGFFKDLSTSEVKMNNFTRIGTALTEAGVTLRAREARAIMRAEPGAVFTLLYNIYLFVQTRLHKGGSQMIPSSRQELRELELQLYKHQLKQLIPRQSDETMAQIVARFEAKRKENMDHAKRERLQSAEQRAERNQTNRRNQMDRGRQIRLAQSELMAKLEANLIDVSKKPPLRSFNREESLKPQKMTREGLNALKDIEQFEQHIESTNMSTNQRAKSQGSTELVDHLRWVRVSGLSDEKRRHAQAAGVFDPKASLNYLERIKERVHEEEMAHQERQKRRRRIIVASLEEHHAREEERRTHQLTDRLRRQSQLERRISVQLAQTKREKSVLLENRLEREREYAAQREVEFQRAMDLQRELELQRKEQESNALAILRQAWANDRARRREESYMRHYRFVSDDVVDLLIQFSVQVADYRGLTGRLIPIKLMRQWKAQFVAGKPFWTRDAEQDPDETVKLGEKELIPKEENADTAQLLDELDLADYRKLDGEWDLSNIGTNQVQSLPGEPCRTVSGQPVEWILNATDLGFPFDFSRPEQNVIFDWLVHRVRHLVCPSPCTPPEPDLPDLPVRMAIIGKPLSGKSTIALKLLETHKCAVLCPTQLVSQALGAYQMSEAAAELEEPTTRSPSQARSDEASRATSSIASELVILGKRIHEELQAGDVVSDQLLVDLVFHAIRSLEPGISFVLDNFPCNVNQTELLIRRLTVDASDCSPTPSPDLAMELLTKLISRRSLDLIILLEVTDDEVLRRAVSQVEETQSDASCVEQSEGTNSIVTKYSTTDTSYGELKTRLASFIDSWSQMESYITENQPTVQILRVDAGGQVDEDGLERRISPGEVLLDIEQIVQSFIDTRQTMSSVEPTESEICTPLCTKLAEGDSTRGITPQEVISSESLNESILTGKESPLAEVVSNMGATRPLSPRQKSGSLSRQSTSDKKAKRKGSAAKRATPTDERQPRSTSKSHRRSDASGKSQKASTDTTKLKTDAVRNEEQIASQLATPELHSPRPGEDGWTFVNLPLELESASTLMHPYESSENNYCQNVKLVFRALRHVRWQFIPHIYEARGEFYNYLQRPDSKQAFVTEFQNSFNSVLNEMRADEETKADLHCRVDDLRDTLYEVLDETKVANEKRIPKCLNPSGWMTEKLCLLANLYLSLMQLEVTRYQDRARLLKDYYSVMERKPQIVDNETVELLTGTIDATSATYSRLPLMQLPEGPCESEMRAENSTTSPISKAQTGKSKSSSSSTKSHPTVNRNRSQTSSSSLSDQPSEIDAELAQIPEQFLTKVNMLHPKSTLNEIHAALTKSGPGVSKSVTPALAVAASSKGGAKTTGKPGTTTGSDKDKQGLPSAATLCVDKYTVPTVQEAQFLYNACLCALQIVVNQFHAERQARAAEAEQDGLSISTPKLAGAKGGHGTTDDRNKVAGAKKGGPRSATSKGRTTKIEGPPTSTELSEEEQLARQMRDRLRKEHVAALENETSATVFRITLIRAQACTVLTDLKMKLNEAEQLMNDWIGTRTLREHDAVHKLVDFVREAIESEQKLELPLVLDGEHFYLQKPVSDPVHEESILATISPSLLAEVPVMDLGYFTLDQLECLLQKFQECAPSGHIETRAFSSLLQPLLDHRLTQISGPISTDLTTDLCHSLAQLYQASFENDIDLESVIPGSRTKDPESIIGNLSPLTDAPKREGDEKVPFYVDWRRFLLAATQSQSIFYPSAKPVQASLIQLANRLYELDQHVDRSHDGQSVTMLHVKVTRAQFQFAPFPWYPSNRDYYRRLQDFIFSLFVENSHAGLRAHDSSSPSYINQQTDSVPAMSKVNCLYLDGTESPKCQVGLEQSINCAQLLLHLSAVGVPNGYVGLLRAVSALLRSHVPHEVILGHEEDTQVQPELEDIPDHVDDVLVPKSVLETILGYGLINSSGTNNETEAECPQLMDVIQPDRFAFRDKLSQIYADLDGGDFTDDPAVPFSNLVQHPGSVELLLSAIPRFQLPQFPEPWPSLIRMYSKPAQSGSTSTLYDNTSKPSIS